ncbi:MAG: BLUF domain-containing protein, partial [Bacteroidota bacterium]
MHALLYRSMATRSLDDADLDHLIRRAARNNTRLGVTGLLVHARMHRKGEGLFAQWLEGDRRVVHDLYETIK